MPGIAKKIPVAVQGAIPPYMPWSFTQKPSKPPPPWINSKVSLAFMGQIFTTFHGILTRLP
jgi:hypothetical protein